MSDIFREIDDELRRDRITSLAQRNAPLIIGAIVLIIAVTIGAVIWQNMRQQRFETDGLTYSKAQALQQQGAADKALAALNSLASKGSDGYAMLARIEAAELKAKGADRAGGLAELRKIADDSSVDETYRDLAMLIWGLFGVDTEKPATVIDAMKPLASGATPWHYTAVEITALAELRAGDRPAALKAYQSLADDLLAPRGLRARAAEIVSGTKN